MSEGSNIGDGYLGVDNFPFAGANYPFLVPTNLNELVEDLHISWQREPLPEVWLKSITGIGQAVSGLALPVSDNAVNLQLSDDTGELILDTALMQLTTRVWGGVLKVHKWVGEDVVIQAVVNHRAEAFDRYEPEMLTIDHRAMEFLPVFLKDLVVGEGVSQVSLLRDDLSLKLSSGYNWRFDSESITSDRGEKLTSLSLVAEPGEGLGRFPGCNADLGITALGRARPTPAGDLLLGGYDCINVRPKVQYNISNATVLTGQFEVTDSCSAPCDCDDFASVANYAVSLWNQFRILATRLSGIRDAYHILRTEILSWKSCTEVNPMRLHIWKAPPCAMGLGAGICNVGSECLTGLSISFRIDDGLGGLIGGVNPNNVFQTRYAGGLGYNTPTGYTSLTADQITVPLGDIEPGQMGFVFLRYDLGEGFCDTSGEVEITLNGTLPPSWSPVAPIVRPFNFA